MTAHKSKSEERGWIGYKFPECFFLKWITRAARINSHTPFIPIPSSSSSVRFLFFPCLQSLRLSLSSWLFILFSLWEKSRPAAHFLFPLSSTLLLHHHLLLRLLLRWPGIQTTLPFGLISFPDHLQSLFLLFPLLNHERIMTSERREEEERVSQQQTSADAKVHLNSHLILKRKNERKGKERCVFL